MAADLSTLSDIKPNEPIVLEFANQRDCPKCKCSNQLRISYENPGTHLLLNNSARYRFETEGFLTVCNNCSFEFVQLIKQEDDKTNFRDMNDPVNWNSCTTLKYIGETCHRLKNSNLYKMRGLRFASNCVILDKDEEGQSSEWSVELFKFHSFNIPGE